MKRENGSATFIVSNHTKSTAIGLKFNLRTTTNYKLILPAYFSDGYFTMFPGEKRQIKVEWNPSEASNPVVLREGYNLKSLFLCVIE